MYAECTKHKIGRIVPPRYVHVLRFGQTRQHLGPSLSHEWPFSDQPQPFLARQPANLTCGGGEQVQVRRSFPMLVVPGASTPCL
jgi:hypothetical protein